MNTILKHIDHQKVVLLKDLVTIREHEVVSRTLHQNKQVSITVFAFDKGEEISSHASGGDAMVTILQGTARIHIGNEEFKVSENETIVMPANVAHALFAIEPFKMILTVVFKEDITEGEQK